MGKTTRRTEADYRELAQQRGFKWIGEYPKNTSIKTRWECGRGHIFEAKYNSICNGHGCRECYFDKKRKLPEDYFSLAQERGLRWLGPEVAVSRANTFWECENGHQWEASYNTVRDGHMCGVCWKDIRLKTPDDYHILARDRGIEWVGKFPKSTQHKTTWACSNGHKWKTTYGEIYKGRGCPSCINFVNGRRSSRQQDEVAEMLEAEVNYKVNNRYLDCALPSQKIAIEYDCWYWHGHKSQEDYKRAMELVDAGWNIIAIKANTQIPTAEQLEECIEQSNKHPYIELVLDWGQGSTKESSL